MSLTAINHAARRLLLPASHYISCSEPLDPTSPTVFAVLEAVFTELATLFPDSIFHQGADEVLDPAEGPNGGFAHEKCWQVS